MKPNQPNQPQKNYLKLSDEDLKKLAKFKADKEAQNIEVDPEWLEISEFGGYFGYPGVQAILNNEIDRDVVQMLIAGQRKVWASHVLDISQAMFVASVSAQSKKPTQTFKKAIKGFLDRMKVEQ